MSNRFLFRWFAALLACAPLTLAAAPVGKPLPRAQVTPDDHFVAAAEAFARANAVKLASHAPHLKGHVLEPYVEYWQLALRIDGASDDAVREFFARHPGTLLEDQLRRDWLRSLVRRGRWDAFTAELPRLAGNGDDPDIACLALQARWRAGETATAGEFERAWRAARELPDGCLAIAEAQIAAGEIATQDVWARVRMLLDAGQITAVKRMMKYLPANERLDERTLNAVRARPMPYLDRVEKQSLVKRADRELAMFAFARAAASDAERTVKHWTPKVQAQFSEEDRARVWGQIATQAARQHHAEALAWFAEAGAAPLSDESLEWRARAALRAGNWAEVRAAIARMTPETRNDATWIYWQARALRASGDRQQATALFRRVASEHRFYGKLALEELGRAVAIPPRGYKPTDDDVAEAAENASLHRALALFRVKMRPEGLREWNWALRDMDDRQLLATAELARRVEAWERAINTADRTVALHDYSMRFLAPYRDAFAEQAQTHGLDEYWVLGLVRQESRFNTAARSPVGASGLMQLMPRTAHWVARRSGMRNFSISRVNDVDVNIALGTSYLNFLLEALDGSPVLAAAAYNAGPGRARKWKADQAIEGAIYIEAIPFAETRDYVKRVMSNTVYYAALYGGEQRSLKSRLGVIPSRHAGESYEPTITGEATVE
jgi:soluble lytic murein transglycosylase